MSVSVKWILQENNAMAEIINNGGRNLNVTAFRTRTATSNPFNFLPPRYRRWVSLKSRRPAMR